MRCYLDTLTHNGSHRVQREAATTNRCPDHMISKWWECYRHSPSTDLPGSPLKKNRSTGKKHRHLGKDPPHHPASLWAAIGVVVWVLSVHSEHCWGRPGHQFLGGRRSAGQIRCESGSGSRGAVVVEVVGVEGDLGKKKKPFERFWGRSQ